MNIIAEHEAEVVCRNEGLGEFEVGERGAWAALRESKQLIFKHRVYIPKCEDSHCPRLVSSRERRVALQIRLGHFRAATENGLEERATGEEAREIVGLVGATRGADQRGVSHRSIGPRGGGDRQQETGGT